MPKRRNEPELLQVRIGRNLRAHRLARGLTQQALADLAKKKRSYVGAVERGERNVLLQQLGQLTAALQLDIFEMFVPR